jgi:hypothetical protein
MYLTTDEIKQLKNDLMSTTNQRTTVYKTFLSYNNSLSEIAQLVNREISNTDDYDEKISVGIGLPCRYDGGCRWKEEGAAALSESCIGH